MVMMVVSSAQLVGIHIIGEDTKHR